jgi:hypothetical protein
MQKRVVGMSGLSGRAKAQDLGFKP